MESHDERGAKVRYIEKELRLHGRSSRATEVLPQDDSGPIQVRELTRVLPSEHTCQRDAPLSSTNVRALALHPGACMRSGYLERRKAWRTRWRRSAAAGWWIAAASTAATTTAIPPAPFPPLPLPRRAAPALTPLSTGGAACAPRRPGRPADRRAGVPPQGLGARHPPGAPPRPLPRAVLPRFSPPPLPRCSRKLPPPLPLSGGIPTGGCPQSALVMGAASSFWALPRRMAAACCGGS